MSNAIEFKLFAPNNKGAALIGSFSDWEEIPMEKDETGCFRTHIDLEDGVYEYKFRVQTKSWFLEPDEWVDVIDPYATDVNESKETGVIRIKEGQRIIDTYVWQHDDKPLPPNGELVLYEMHIGDFCGMNDSRKSGSYKIAIEKLDYLCELGINAIELMPIAEFPGDKGWGYLVRHYFATESSYGSTEDLKRLIDECHGRGIRVIMDGIYNHSDDKNPLLLIDRDYWYYHDKHYPDDPDNYWGPEFNYDRYDENLDIRPAWNYIGDVVRFWIQEYHIDGIRYDALSQLANRDFLHWITQQAREAAGSKPFYNIGEHIPENPSIAAGFEGPMDGIWHDSFRYFVVAHICGDTFELEKLKEVLDGKRQGYSDATNIVNYLSNHDHDRILANLGDRGFFDEAAFQRAKLGAVLLMTAMGLPLIWMGEEFGQAAHTTPNAKCQVKWLLLKNDLNRSLLELYKGLIALRKQNPALKGENIEFFHEDPDRKVLAYVRWNEEGSRVVVVANFSDNYLGSYEISNFPENGTWHEWTRDYDVESKDDRLIIDLGEGEAQVFVWQP